MCCVRWKNLSRQTCLHATNNLLRLTRLVWGTCPSNKVGPSSLLSSLSPVIPTFARFSVCPFWLGHLSPPAHPRKVFVSNLVIRQSLRMGVTRFAAISLPRPNCSRAPVAYRRSKRVLGGPPKDTFLDPSSTFVHTYSSRRSWPDPEGSKQAIWCENQISFPYLPGLLLTFIGCRRNPPDVTSHRDIELISIQRP